MLGVAPVVLAKPDHGLVPFLLSLEPSEPRAERHAAAGEERPAAMALLLAVVAFRSVAWFGLITFVPLWEVSLGQSKSYGSHLLSLMLVTGAVGTLLAGPAADHASFRSFARTRAL